MADVGKKWGAKNAVARGVKELRIQVVQPQRAKNEELGLEEEVLGKGIDQDHKMTKVFVWEDKTLTLECVTVCDWLPLVPVAIIIVAIIFIEQIYLKQKLLQSMLGPW